MHNTIAGRGNHNYKWQVYKMLLCDTHITLNLFPLSILFIYLIYIRCWNPYTALGFSVYTHRSPIIFFTVTEQKK